MPRSSGRSARARPAQPGPPGPFFDRGNALGLLPDTFRLTRSQIIAQREAAGLPTDVVPEKKVTYSKPLHVALDTVGLTKGLLYEQKVEEANEQRWAEAAQAVLRGRGSKTA